MAAKRDCWAEWVARMGPEPDETEHPHWRWRDRILANAAPIDGRAVVLDVGCGDGLVGFGALDRGSGSVVFSDISRDLLDVCRRKAGELGVLDRCSFVLAPAEDLAGVEDESVDVVTTRSVLIYVKDKLSAFAEFARVLRPGGRISLFEPINRFARTGRETWAGYDLSPIPEIARKIRAVYDAIQPADTDPMLDFDERDLVRFAEGAGFFPIAMELEVELRPTEPMPWEGFIGKAGNPRIPTPAEATTQALTADERRRLTEHLRPLVEQGLGVRRTAVAYLHATKPASAAVSASER